MHMGMDIGSKTLKIVVLDDGGKVVYSCYRRHRANIKETLLYALEDYLIDLMGDTPFTMGVTGAGATTIARLLDVPFMQEVVALEKALETYFPHVDVALEIGGEDSKICFLSDGKEMRMNNTCAGGTGGFIDAIAQMLGTDTANLDKLAAKHKTTYSIASRCAVFAQTDVRSLLNEGASRENIAASVLKAVVTQCIAGLACGRRIRENVVLLGGPISFLPQLQNHFRQTLSGEDVHLYVPEQAHLYTARGIALWVRDNPESAPPERTVSDLIAEVERLELDTPISSSLPPLFKTKTELASYKRKKMSLFVPRKNIKAYTGPAFLGIDSGSTSLKAALIGEQGELLFSFYEPLRGDVVNTAKKMLLELYAALQSGGQDAMSVSVLHATVTGYGEDLLRNIFLFDSGEVETVAHAKAATTLQPAIDGILDIGGQDIKCMILKDGVIDEILLNEACSSGCGSMISGFARSMKLGVWAFSERALYAENPIDLGSRCTVFMSSRIRHAQKEGAPIDDIAAGLAYSIAKNINNKILNTQRSLPAHATLMVQGGAFRSDAVLRAFELVSKKTVLRPDIAELMGAYGAALTARERAVRARMIGTGIPSSSMLAKKSLLYLVEKQTSTRCPFCNNHCPLTVHTVFVEKKRKLTAFVSGNACPRGEELLLCEGALDEAEGAIVAKPSKKPLYNFATVTYDALFSYAARKKTKGRFGEIGMIRALDTYASFPFWYTFFEALGFSVVLSDATSTGQYMKGMETIPSESVCLPAKLAHGHCIELLERGVATLFLPRFTADKTRGDSCRPPDHNEAYRQGAGRTCFTECPVRLHYATALATAVSDRDSAQNILQPLVPFRYLDSVNDEAFIMSLQRGLKGICAHDFSSDDLRSAYRMARKEHASFKKKLIRANREAYETVVAKGERAALLAMHPYHLDPFVHHGLPDLLNTLGLHVFTLDLFGDHGMDVRSQLRVGAEKTSVSPDPLSLFQVRSFSCALGAAAYDENHGFFQEGNGYFTGLNIDDMTDLGALKIRIKSTLSLMDAEACEKHARS